MEKSQHIDEACVNATLPPELESDVAPWELIDIGRYRPRRIRGSFRGRELG